MGSPLSRGTFSCESCGKTFKWKPQIAGRSATCGCGAKIQVPRDEPAADDDLYGLPDAPTDAETRAVLPSATVAVANPEHPASYPAGIGEDASVTLPYRSAPTARDREKDRFRDDNVFHPARDWYVPITLLIAGAVSMAVWGTVVDAGAIGMFLVIAFTAMTTLVKTAIIIALAFTAASMFGFSFGPVRSAILKFAAIVVFTDAIWLWFEFILDSMGSLPTTGRTAGRILFIQLAFVAAIISFLAYYLFDLDSDEAKFIAFPLALVTWIVDLVLGFIAMAILTAMFAPPAPARPTRPVRQQQPAVVLSESDQQLTDRVKENILVKEAREYNERSIDPVEKQLVQMLYSVGAKKVYFDSEGSPRLRPIWVYVELPADPAMRGQCIDACVHYCEQNQIPIDPASTVDDGQKFVVIPLKQR